MIEYNGKDLYSLNFNECLEFEKQMLKKILGASRAGMSNNIIEQLQFYLSLIQEQKRTAMHKEIEALGPDKKISSGVSISTDPDDEDIND